MQSSVGGSSSVLNTTLHLEAIGVVGTIMEERENCRLIASEHDQAPRLGHDFNEAAGKGLSGVVRLTSLEMRPSKARKSLVQSHRGIFGDT